MSSTRVVGTVKFYKPEEKYGFITPHEGGKDIFVHAETVKRAGLEDLKAGDVVSYCIYRSKKHGKGKIAAKELQLTGW